jgi:tRNA threonylcarbamoyl adenosine modification protein (Sua5/YciO/YrdC/YwlC family)
MGVSVKVFDCLDLEARAEGLSAALEAISADELVVIPTDTGYALAGDAFSTSVARRIRSVKAMEKNAPLQVLISDKSVLSGIANPASYDALALSDAFWPGPLTLILPAQPTVVWDIGAENSIVQVRVPKNAVAEEILMSTGPLAVSAARNSGSSIITSVDDVTDLEHHVVVFLNAGVITPQLSTIVDCTTSEPVAVIRKGPISVGQIVDVLGYMPRTIVDPA